MLPAVGQGDVARVGVRGRGCIPVHGPDQPPLVGQHQVGVGIPGDEVGERRQPIPHFAPDHHPAVRREVPREQDVVVAAAHGRRQPHEQRRDREPARAFVGREDIVRAGRIVELLLRRVYENRFVDHFAVVDLRPRELQARGLDLRRGVLDEKHRQAVGGDLVGLRHHHAIAVGVDEVRIDPASACVGQLPDIQLARREQHLAATARRSCSDPRPCRRTRSTAAAPESA